jgi:hypothetical protein
MASFYKSPETLARKVERWREGMKRCERGEGFIYLAEIIGADVVKIGYSLNPKTRIKQFWMHPSVQGHKARLLATCAGTIQQERAFHRRLRDDPLSLDYEFYDRAVVDHPQVRAFFGIPPRAPEGRAT